MFAALGVLNSGIALVLISFLSSTLSNQTYVPTEAPTLSVYPTISNQTNETYAPSIEDSCSNTSCKSPDGKGGFDCYAGSWSEPCECSEGIARETGKTIHYQGEKYYEYTCCVNGSNEGRECGEYNESLFLTLVIALPILFLAALSYSCYYCYKVRKSAPWHHKHGFLRRKQGKYSNPPSSLPTLQQHHHQLHSRVPLPGFSSIVPGRVIQHTNERVALPSATAPPAPTFMNSTYYKSHNADRENNNCFFCPHCGTSHNGVGHFCVTCGSRLVGRNTQPLIPEAMKLT